MVVVVASKGIIDGLVSLLHPVRSTQFVFFESSDIDALRYHVIILARE